LRESGYVSEGKQNAKNILTPYDAAAKGLGNTRSVCKSYYVHPVIPEAYADGSITPYFDKVDNVKLKPNSFISKTETVITEMLGDYEISL
jgi:DNA topoisomerase-1